MVVSALTIPAPARRALATFAPLDGLFNASVTFTTKGANVALTVSDCPLPETSWMFTGPASVPVAVNVLGEPESAPAFARTVMGPGVVGVRVTEAYPVSSLTVVPVDNLPPPAVTLHVTGRPLNPAFSPSSTCTVSGAGSAALTGPVCPFPPTMTSTAAGGTTCTRVESLRCVGVSAMTHALSRRGTAPVKIAVKGVG